MHICSMTNLNPKGYALCKLQYRDVPSYVWVLVWMNFPILKLTAANLVHSQNCIALFIFRRMVRPGRCEDIHVHMLIHILGCWIYYFGKRISSVQPIVSLQWFQAMNLRTYICTYCVLSVTLIARELLGS